MNLENYSLCDLRRVESNVKDKQLWCIEKIGDEIWPLYDDAWYRLDKIKDRLSVHINRRLWECKHDRL